MPDELKDVIEAAQKAKSLAPVVTAVEAAVIPEVAGVAFAVADKVVAPVAGVVQAAEADVASVKGAVANLGHAVGHSVASGVSKGTSAVGRAFKAVGLFLVQERVLIAVLALIAVTVFH